MLSDEIEERLLAISRAYREKDFDDISIGKTKYEAIVASLHAQAGFMAGYRKALKDIESNEIKKPYFKK